MSIRDTVAAVFTAVAKEQNRRMGPLHDDAALMDLGIDSLCLAIIVARLEASLGTDPFSAGDEVEIPATYGEFVALYDHAVV
jgi:aryl carrier-like protein